jgi:hypothetical protein
MFNPIDWLSWIYGKLFVNLAPAWGYLAICLAASLVGSILWAIAVEKYKEQHLQPAATAASAGAASLPLPAGTASPTSMPTPTFDSTQHKMPPTKNGSSATSRRPSVNAPNGIAIGGNNFGNATVNNYGPITPKFRTLPPDKLQELSGKLKADHAGKLSIIVVADKDGESDAFAKQILEAFTRAGWQIAEQKFTGSLNMAIMGDSGVRNFDGGGLHCYGSQSAQELVVKAFNSVGLECKTDIPLSSKTGADICITVGPR